MTPEQTAAYFARVAQAVAEGRERIQVSGLKVMELAFKRRVFNAGQAESGSPIGTYSSAPAYFSREQFVKKSAFKPQGKGGKGKKGAKSMYLPGGYAQFRQVQGYQSTYVDAQLSGSLMTSLVVGQGENGPAFGFVAASEVKKARGIEKQKGKEIFIPGEAEIEAAEDAMHTELIQLLQENGL